METKDYDVSILSGNGENDYEKYMRTNELLSLQVIPEKMIHRDELLFQIVHQSTELWLKLSNNELSQALEELEKNNFCNAMVLIKRSIVPIQQITHQLDMLKQMTPYDFKQVRPALGNGSGFESPGWKSLQKLGKRLNKLFEKVVDNLDISMIDIYTSDEKTDLFFLMEAMIDWDEAVGMWRSKHYKIAVRTIGLNTVGTKGTPIETLTVLMNSQFFPNLWALRTTLTNDLE